MSDIQQWRRKIQPARVPTPAIEHDDHDGLHSPKRGLKPKISSYFTAHGAPKPEASSSFVADDFHGFGYSFQPHTGPCPDPGAENLIESVMCRLLNNPFHPLDMSMNGTLLRIFESHRVLSDETRQLQSRLDEQAAAQKTVAQQMRSAQKQWHEERSEFKAEVKRLELLLARGKRGLAEVTLARQDSALRQRNSINKPTSSTYDDGLETIFEFLEKTRRYEDKAWSSQRATFRARPTSPSKQMRRLSQQLVSKKSMTNIHADLPFGTPPDLPLSTLVEASVAEAATVRPVSEARTSFSDDTVSTFSCLGDLLPDEANGHNETANKYQDDDSFDIKRVGVVPSHRRRVDQVKVAPKLSGVFDSPVTERSSNRSTLGEFPVPPSYKPTRGKSQSGKGEATSDGTVSKHPSLMAKASGLFHRFKPQLNTEAPWTIDKRFSFESGDEARAFNTSASGYGLISNDKPRLRKSASLSSLSTRAAQQFTTSFLGPVLSPVIQSPTTSVPMSETRRTSRIPTPIKGSASSARPRRQRDDSSSSLLTAINLSEEISPRHESTFNFGSPVASGPNLSHPTQRVGSWTAKVKSPGGSNLVDDTPSGSGPDESMNQMAPTANKQQTKSHHLHSRHVTPPRRYSEAKQGAHRQENTKPSSRSMRFGSGNTERS